MLIGSQQSLELIDLGAECFSYLPHSYLQANFIFRILCDCLHAELSLLASIGCRIFIISRDNLESALTRIQMYLVLFAIYQKMLRIKAMSQAITKGIVDRTRKLPPFTGRQ